MKLKIPIVNLDELEDSIIPLEYDDLMPIETIFYNMDYIQPSIKGYSVIGLHGYEYTAKMPYTKLEREIDRQNRIIITDN